MSESLDERVQRLEGRLRALEAVEAIRGLKARYAETVDRRFSRGRALEPEPMAEVCRDVAALFTEDGVWDGGPALGIARGREEIAARLAQPTLQFAWHYFVKPRIEVDGDRATGRWDVLSPCTTHDGRPHWMAGVEDDEYVCVDGHWLHSRMKLTAVFMAPHETGWQKIWL